MSCDTGHDIASGVLGYAAARIGGNMDKDTLLDLLRQNATDNGTKLYSACCAALGVDCDLNELATATEQDSATA